MSAPPYPGQPGGYAQPPNQQQHTTVYVQQPQHVYVQQQQQKTLSSSIAGSLGGALSSAVRSGGQLVKGSGKTASSVAKSGGGALASIGRSSKALVSDTAQGFQDQSDKTASSPLLSCFSTGSGIQLISKNGKGCLRALPDGNLDGRGMIGNDYSCHWLVVQRWENKVILRNGAFPQYHLANAAGRTVCTGVGDNASVFKLHETMSHYITLQHFMTDQYVGIDNQKNIVPAGLATSGGDSLFDVHLVYSPVGHMYKSAH